MPGAGSSIAGLPIRQATEHHPMSDIELYYHGTKAALAPGDLIVAGYASNFGKRRNAKYVYLTAMLEAATWGAELAAGEGRGHIYIVEPTGPFEEDPSFTGWAEPQAICINRGAPASRRWVDRLRR